MLYLCLQVLKVSMETGRFFLLFSPTHPSETLLTPIKAATVTNNKDSESWCS